jgi:hypothetical protein
VRGSQWRLQAEKTEKTEKTERSRVVRVSAERGVGGMEEALGGWFGRRGALVGVVRRAAGVLGDGALVGVVRRAAGVRMARGGRVRG